MLLSKIRANRKSLNYLSANKSVKLFSRDASTSSIVFPSVRRLLKENSLDFKDLPPKIGTGPKGIILKGDILNFIKTRGSSSKSQPVKQAPVKSRSVTTTKYVDLEVSNMRRVIANRLSESKGKTPHSYVSQDCNVDNLIKYRKMINDTGTKVSLNDMIIQCSAIALSQVPEANIFWNPKTQSVESLNSVDISVAVAIEDGLITPIIKDANTKGLLQISAEMKDLAKRAKEKGLLPHEYQGGSFSISNLGMFGISNFIAVINPPQSMILAIGGTSDKLTLVDDSKLITSKIMNVTLSFDSRAISPEVAGKWLSTFKSIVENPLTLLK